MFKKAYYKKNYIKHMKPQNPQLILEKLQLTLKNNKIDFEKVIEDFGQVEAAEKRENEYKFTLEEHIKGLIFSMLSSQQQWNRIVKKIDKINEVFFNYDPIKLETCDTDNLLNQVLSIKCGNKQIKDQIKFLPHNIRQFKKIEKDYGSMDDFITSGSAEEVANLLSNGKSEYKIKMIGIPLAMEYLKSVGINTMKPDTHIVRICGPERLDIIPAANPETQLNEFKKFAKAIDVSPTYLDNIFWIFGAKGYGDICAAEPKCNLCELSSYCNYNK